MHFEIQAVFGPAKFVRLIDDVHRRINGNPRKQPVDVLGIHPDATVRNAHANASGPIGPVNKVTRHRKPYSVLAQRVVGTGCNHRWQRVAFCRMFGPHRCRRIPGRPNHLANDMRFADRRLPVAAPYANRERSHIFTLG